MQYQLNEHITLTSQQAEELANLTTVVADYERRLVKEHGESERRQHDCELMQRAKEQKERHMAVLMRENEKVKRQLDQFAKATPSSEVKPPHKAAPGMALIKSALAPRPSTAQVPNKENLNSCNTTE